MADVSAPLCVLTGTASGIGRELARRLAAEGRPVLGLDHQPAPPDMPSGFTALRCDLAQWQPSDDDAFRRALGDRPVAAFVHAAGAVRSGGAHDTRLDDAAWLYRLHVESAMRLMALMHDRLGRGARIVLVSSRGVLGRANRAPYAASKAAQLGLARSWAAEFVARGITVNVVAPAATDTAQLTDPQRGAPAQVDLPIGRLVTPDEVAGTIAFLLGPDAGAITGQTLYVCGGASLGVAHV